MSKKRIISCGEEQELERSLPFSSEMDVNLSSCVYNGGSGFYVRRVIVLICTVVPDVRTSR